MAIATDDQYKRSTDAAAGDDQQLAELLCNNGTLTEQDFKRILSAQREHGGRFSEVAQRLGLLTERDVRRALAKRCELPSVLPDPATLSRRLTAAYQPFNARSEALRSLRSELLLRWFDLGRNMLAIGEARHYQGAVTLAGNLAWSLAQLGRRTLLIDADLRRPQQQAMFKLRNDVGLAEFLNGACDLPDVLHPVPGFSQLSVLYAGRPPANPQELLSLQSYEYLLDSLSEQFECIIVTGPPMLNCSDMQLIAAQAGGCLLMLRRHKTRLLDVQLAKLQLRTANVELVGMVIDG